MDLDPIKEMEMLSQFFSDDRKKRIDEVLAQRTQHLTVVLEDIYHPPNASAVLRTAECLGIQDIHVIENLKKYRPNSDVAIGASKWLNIYHYRQGEDNSTDCIDSLKKKGYRIAVTLPDGGDVKKPEDIEVEHPLAVCFGTEETGLSSKIIEKADFKIKIPMYGFTSSYNISVSAAIILYELRKKLQYSINKDDETDIFWKLDEKIKEKIKLDWHRKCLKNHDKVLNHLLDRKSESRK